MKELKVASEKYW